MTAAGPIKERDLLRVGDCGKVTPENPPHDLTANTVGWARSPAAVTDDLIDFDDDIGAWFIEMETTREVKRT